MNKLTIIGNLTRDPDTRQTQSGIPVCTFNVAVNQRVKQGEEPKTDFFRVTAWRQLAEICGKFLAKGRKVCVVGPVSVRTYEGQDGQVRASIEVTADEIEFLTPKSTEAIAAPETAPAVEAGPAPETAPVAEEAPAQTAPAMTPVPPEDEELPF